MGSLTKEQRDAEEKIKQKIVAGCARGVCNRDGHSERGPDGAYRPAMTFHQKQAMKKKKRA